jgi:hypothetical protein
MRFLRPRNGLKVNLIEDIKLHLKRWLEHPGRMDRSRLPKLLVTFQYQLRARRDAARPGKEQEHQELYMNRSEDLTLVYVHEEEFVHPKSLLSESPKLWALEMRPTM